MERKMSGRRPIDLAAALLFVCSIIADATAAGQTQGPAQQERRLAFLDRLDPIWIAERLDIQRHELKRYLWRHCFSVEIPEFVALTPSLAVVVSYSAGTPTRIGLTARQYIADLDYEALRELRGKCPLALTTLQTADKAELKRKSLEMVKAWLTPLVPLVGPNERALTIAQRISLLEYCLNNLENFLRACPALAVEDALSRVRTRDPRRVPGESDGPDLQHMVSALPNCDVFLSRDKYQLSCATAAHSDVPGIRFAALYSSSRDLAAAFGAATR
jgi:hypothetical protein